VIERAARRDVPGDVGDRDHEVPTAGVFRIGVGFGPDRIVKIARVAAVDRHQIEATQIGAAGCFHRGRRGGFCQRGFGKDMWDLETGDRDQADRAGCIGRAEAFDNPQARRSIAASGQGFRRDQLPVESAAGMREVDKVFGAIAAVRGDDPPAIMAVPEDPDDAIEGLPVYGFAGRLDEARLDLAGVAPPWPDFLAVAPRAGFRPVLPFDLAVAGRADLAAAERPLRAVLPFAFCASSSGSASANVNRSGSAPLGKEAISPLWPI